MPDDLARAAADAELGDFVAPLTPSRRTASLEALAGGATAAAVAWCWWLAQPSTWWLVGLLVLLAVIGLVVLAVGLIGLAPGPGRVLLFEDGLVCVRSEDDVEVLRY